MSVSRGLRRLLRIRELEEEQNRLALEAAIGEVHRLEHALAMTAERDRQGRRLVAASAGTGDLVDRLAGLEETRSAGRRFGALVPRIATAEGEVAGQRREFLGKRVERRQAETLIREGEARSAVEVGRHSQQAIDDWHSSRLHRAGVEAGQANPPTSAGASDGSDPIESGT